MTELNKTIKPTTLLIVFLLVSMAWCLVCISIKLDYERKIEKLMIECPRLKFTIHE